MRPTLYPVDRRGPGRLATMAKPRGGDWLDDELLALKAEGVDVLVCALTTAEATELGLAAEPHAARGAGLSFVSIPIRDRDVPDLAAVAPTLRDLAARYRGGAHVVTHCGFGICRESLLAAAILVLDGVRPNHAWHLLEQARGQAVPDTEAQRQWPATLLDNPAPRHRPGTPAARPSAPS